MNIKQKTIALVCSLVAFMGVLMASPVAHADCGGVKTSIINCSQPGGDKDKGTKDVQKTGVWGLLIFILNIMTGGVGIAAVGGMVYAAILYASSSDSAEQVKRAKDIMRNIAIGIIAYVLMYVLINFIVPGGVFK
jgi:amino acid transporter